MSFCLIVEQNITSFTNDTLKQDQSFNLLICHHHSVNKFLTSESMYSTWTKCRNCWNEMKWMDSQAKILHCKVILGKWQSWLMRWVLLWITQQVQDRLLDRLTCSLVCYHCATAALSLVQMARIRTSTAQSHHNPQLLLHYEWCEVCHHIVVIALAHGLDLFLQAKTQCAFYTMTSSNKWILI